MATIQNAEELFKYYAALPDTRELEKSSLQTSYRDYLEG